MVLECATVMWNLKMAILETKKIKIILGNFSNNYYEMDCILHW